MHKSLLKLSFFLILLGLFGCSSSKKGASKKGYEGTVDFAISYSELPASMKGLESMLPNSQHWAIKDGAARVQEKTSAWGEKALIKKQNDSESSVLIKVLGEQFLIADASDEFPTFSQVTYFKETKEIAGYKCKKAEAVISETAEPLVIYYTTKLPAGPFFPGMPGFPLQYQAVRQEVLMTFTATKVTPEKVADQQFEVPARHIKITKEALKRKFGG